MQMFYWWSVQTGKFGEEMRIPDHLTCLLRNLYSHKKQQLELDMEQRTDCFRIRKGVCQGCILSPCLINLYACLTCEMLGCMKHKLESRLLGEISITSDVQMTQP